jgi:RNA polymerase sigma-70 factor (ECF subfamily)
MASPGGLAAAALLYSFDLEHTLAMASAQFEKSIMFAELLHEAHADIFSFIFAMVLNQADAEDLYQETGALLWEKFDEFEPNTDFRRWAIRVAHLKVLNFVRKNRRRKVLFGDDVLQTIAETHEREAASRNAARAAALQICMKKLPAVDKRLVDSRYAGSSTVQEIAATEGRSVDAVYKAMSRIRQALLACIERRLAMENR